MDASSLPLLVVLGVLLIGSGVASASETALFGLSRAKRARLSEEHAKLGWMVERLLASPRRLLLQVLLINMATNVAYFIVSSVITLRASSPAWQIGFSIASVFAIILIGEVFAKLVAVLAPVATLRALAPLQLLAMPALRPITAFLDTLFITPATRLMVPDALPDRAVTPEEMGTLLEIGAKEGVIDSSEQDLLSSIVMLSQRRVEEIMRPRVDFAWLDIDSDHGTILEVCAREGHTSFPVFDGGVDGTPVGMVDAKRVLAGDDLRSAIRPVHFIPEQATIDALLAQFRDSSRTIALCVDEHGTVVGLVSLADVAEQLITGITDEGTPREQPIELIGLGRWLVPGRLNVRDWAAFFDRGSDHTHAQTLAGLIMHELGRLPVEGDRVELGTLVLTVRAMDGRRVHQVEVALALSDEIQEEAS